MRACFIFTFANVKGSKNRKIHCCTKYDVWCTEIGTVNIVLFF